MKKRVVMLAVTLILALGTSVAFGWTHFFSYSYDLPAGASRTTATFTSTGNFTLNHSQSVPNVTANNAQVRITVWKGNTIVKSETVTGDNVTKMIAVSSGKGTYKIKFDNISNYLGSISGSAMK